jgi:hypothetical protein
VATNDDGVYEALTSKVVPSTDEGGDDDAIDTGEGGEANTVRGVVEGFGVDCSTESVVGTSCVGGGADPGAGVRWRACGLDCSCERLTCGGVMTRHSERPRG